MLTTRGGDGAPKSPVVLGAGTKRRKRKLTGMRVAPYLLSAPALLLYVAFVIIPVGYTLWLSGHGYRVQGGGSLLGSRTLTWVGFENYLTVFSDPAYTRGLVNVLLYGLIAIPGTLGLALLFALLLDTPGVRTGKFSRAAIFIPYAVPGVVAALLWGFMYLPSTSPVSYLTKLLGFGSVPFLESPEIYGSLANIAIWGGVGFNMIIIYTSLRSISPDILESAQLDGASEPKIALKIKIPLVVPALVLTGFFSIIGTLQLYNEPNTLKTMTDEIGQTWVPLMTIYRDAFMTDNLPLAAAASVILAVATIGASLLVLYAVRRRSAR